MFRHACTVTTLTLAIGAAVLGSAAESAAQVVARSADGTTITRQELDSAIGYKLTAIRAEAYEQERHALKRLLAEKLLDQEARRRNLSREAFDAQEIDAKLTPIAEEEITATYEARRASFRNRTEADARKEIADALRTRQRNVVRNALVKQLMDRAGARILLEPPRVAIDPGEDPARGPAHAPVTLIVYSDFQCPFCAKMEGVLASLLQRYPTQLRIVYKDFPLPIHREAARAAEAARCAGEQGKYWEMRDRLFLAPKDLAEAALPRHGVFVGLNGNAFAECFESRRYEQTVKANKAEGDRYGVMGTPGLFLNGRFINGLTSLDVLVELIDEELTGPALATPTSARSSAGVEKATRPH